MDKKIYWCLDEGTVYWMEGSEIFFAPMNNDGTSNLEDGGLVENWDDCAPFREEDVRAKLA